MQKLHHRIIECKRIRRVFQGIVITLSDYENNTYKCGKEYLFTYIINIALHKSNDNERSCLISILENMSILCEIKHNMIRLAKLFVHYLQKFV